jgi:purine catabolism regulator
MGLTLARALKLDGLREGSLLSGRRNLGRQIEFVDIIESPVETDWDMKGALFITTFYASRDDAREQLRTIDVLDQHGCVALVFQVGFLDHLPEEVVAHAERIGFPIISIPREVTYPVLIQPLVGAILREKAVLLQRSDEINQRMMDICLAGGGIDAIVVALGDLLGRPARLFDPWGGMMAAAPAEGEAASSVDLPSIEACYKKARSEPVFVPSLESWAMRISVGKNRECDGYLLLDDPARSLDALDFVAIERASVAIALELVKRRAVVDMERSIRRDFMEDFLNEENPNAGKMVERARSLGWDLKDKHVVALFDSGEASPSGHADERASNERRERARALFFDHATALMLDKNPDGILTEQGRYIVLIPQCSMPRADPSGRSALLELMNAMGGLLRKTMDGSSPRIGVGGFYDSVDGLLRSFNEAKAALDVSTKLGISKDIVWYDEVSLYCLLDRLGSQKETAQWLRHCIGRLMDYDDKKGTGLVKTLETYFDCGQHLQEAAYHLNVHPKTLKYRLDRVKDLLDVDPFMGEQQLSYYLACKIARFADPSSGG